MLRTIALCVLALPIASAPARAAERWELQYFFDVIDTRFVIMDLAFPSPARGIAAGYTIENDKVRPYSVVTSDGGRTWAEVKIKEPGYSLFFLDDSIGWMVTEKGLWRTYEAGRNWEKVSKERDMLRVHFLTEERGFAVGREKSVWETEDGGETWTPVAAAAAPKTSKENTVYTWIEFANPLYGSILGYSEPPRSDRNRFPDWMDPERATSRKQWPTSTIVLQTKDGGRNWEQSTTSMFGRIERMRMKPDGSGLALVRFQHQFEWPSELYRINLQKNETERTFREKDRSITGVALAGDTAYIAGFEPPGKLIDASIPGRLVVLRSSDLENWEEMEVDYRAVARRAVLAAADASNVWIGTDTGMILRLVSE